MKKYNYINLKYFLGFFIFSLGAFSQTTLLAPKLEKDGVEYTYMCSRSNADTFPINFSFQGDPFNSSNVFYVELSDADGGWDSPENLKSITGENDTYNVSTSITLPSNVYGKGYKLRIRSTNPEIISPSSDVFEAFYIGDVQTPVLNNREDIILCDGTTQTISLDDDTRTYVWYKDNDVIPGETSSSITVSGQGRYYAKPDFGRCISVYSNSVSVAVFSNQSVTLKGDDNVVLCGGQSYTFESTFTNTRDFEYVWYKDDVVIEGATGTTYTTPTNNQFGVYQLALKPKNNTCESRSQKVTLSQKTGNEFEVKVESKLTSILLPSASEILEISHTASQGSVKWYFNDQEIAGAQGLQISASIAGTYYAEVTDTSADCPFVKQSEVITLLGVQGLKPIISVNSGYEPCTSTSTDISFIGAEVIATDDNTYTLTAEQVDRLSLNWYKSSGGLSPGVGNSLLPSNEDRRRIDISSYQENGTYFVEASIRDLKGDSEPVEVSLLAKEFELESSSVSNVLCSSETISLRVDPIVSGHVYEWFKDDVAIDNTSSEFEVSEIGKYKVKVSGFGCEKELEVEIKEFDASVIEVSPSEKAILPVNGSVEIVVKGADSYEWYNDKGDLVSLTDTFEAENIGVYKLVAKVNECSVEKLIEVVEDDGNFTIPNIVTPFNTDGVNDTWQLPNKFAFQPTVNVIIFDSRGKEVLNTSDYQNNWPEENNLQDGMLFYFKVIKEDELVKAGTISVLK